MEEIKKRFETFIDRDEYKGHVHRDTTAEEMLAFIQSEINLAVSKERERIVEEIRNFEFDSGFETVFNEKYRLGKEKAREELINLINTK